MVSGLCTALYYTLFLYSDGCLVCYAEFTVLLDFQRRNGFAWNCFYADRVCDDLYQDYSRYHKVLLLKLLMFH